MAAGCVSVVYIKRSLYEHQSQDDVERIELALSYTDTGDI